MIATSNTAVSKPAAAHQSKAAAIFTALGIVFGDIGTSPLYVFPAMRKALGGHIDASGALGSFSLIVWTLIIVVSLKYCLVVMRADNRGEGGILALMSLTGASWRGSKRFLILLGLIGAALIYGDGVITPAISVLSAVEGLNVASSAFTSYTMPIAGIILLGLFLIQRLGTSAVASAFGPIMALWFVTIGVLGIVGIARHPGVLSALHPGYAILFIFGHGFVSVAILGAVFLSVTGAEAMYADMGHMGRSPIRIAWFALVLPALLLNYAGQTAALLGSSADENTFFTLAPGWALYPLVGFATIATIIASQAIITGSFSLTRQAMQLGWLPGTHIDQTSSEEYGQIYVPFVNWTMMFATLALTIIFASSDKLAGAYGTAVSTTMLMTTVLLYPVMRKSWGMPAPEAFGISFLFAIVDIAFFGANLFKIADGGWVPLLIGGLILIVMTTWHDGLAAMHRVQHQDDVTIEHFARQLREKVIKRVPGKAIFLTRLQGSVPPVIADHIKQMGCIFSEIVALTVEFDERPRVNPRRRIQIKRVSDGFWHITIRFGFVEIPNVPKVLHTEKGECPIDLDEALYFGERDRVTRRKTTPRLSSWRRHLFSFLYRNSSHLADRFNLPSTNYVQIGRQREI